MFPMTLAVSVPVAPFPRLTASDLIPTKYEELEAEVILLTDLNSVELNTVAPAATVLVVSVCEVPSSKVPTMVITPVASVS